MGMFNERVGLADGKYLPGRKVRISARTKTRGCRFNCVRELTENFKSPCSPNAPRTIRGERRAEVEGVLEAQISVPSR